MTEIFAFGSINLTDIFGVTDATQVKEALRPYLYIGQSGTVYLNVSFKNLREEFYKKTHTLVASKKGSKETLEICKLQEYIREQTQQAPQPISPSSPTPGYENYDDNIQF